MASRTIRALSEGELEAQIATAHSNLTTFAAVVAVLEGGCVYGGLNSDKAALRIIRAAQTEQQRLIKIYDECRDETARRRNEWRWANG
ncbi:hypothetical protein CNECB9_1150011 [Cupriavidus necator]|uniref:Uncharacterized protein n=1 Tax=Cupriavidus necator TaxID=106590 RepID=A0A1K0JDT4_CUPNE|nr:hypothetical protein CNECB9_1150011 [Cupriavidus necator]